MIIIHRLTTICFFLLTFVFAQAQVAHDTIKIKRTFTSEWIDLPIEIIGDKGVTTNRDDFTRYGSYKHLRIDSTGFFYVKKMDDRWWLMDPDGFAGINMAVSSFGKTEVLNDYGVVVKNGFNGIGNFIENENQTDSVYNLQNKIQLSYTRRLNFFLSYQKIRKDYYMTPAEIQKSLNYIYVLDPMFEEYCFELAKNKVLPFAEERNLLGWFTDNEINFNQDQLKNLIKYLPAGDPSRNSALAFAKSKGLTEYDCVNYTAKVTEEIKVEFAALLAEHYFKIVSSAIRKYDKNHLMLGSRLNGRPRAIQAVVNASHKYMDVTSVNFYDRLAPDEQIALQGWTNDHPCLVGEFYTKDINVFKIPQSGTGFYVNSQADRGKFYQNTCLQLLRNKCFIGWHYFRFIDNVDSNKGIVNTRKQEYTDMTRYMSELNYNVYSICNYYDKNR